MVNSCQSTKLTRSCRIWFALLSASLRSIDINVMHSAIAQRGAVLS